MTQKIVISSCFGGFGLSDAAVKRYAEIKGLTLYPESEPRFHSTTYWLVPEPDRVKELPGHWMSHPLVVREEYNRKYTEQVLSQRDIARDDPALVQVVEELGSKANGAHANLSVVEIPDDVGTNWHIHEYDGFERVDEDHRTWS